LKFRKTEACASRYFEHSDLRGRNEFCRFYRYRIAIGFVFVVTDWMLLAKWFTHTHLRDMTTPADSVAFEPSHTNAQPFARIAAFGTQLNVAIGGDALDVVWRANRRNLTFLRDWLRIEGSPK
jgi:hypothetical protein